MLEDDQIDRLCAELPSVIKQAKAFINLVNSVGVAVGEKDNIVDMLTPLTWIDDHKSDVTISLHDDSEELLTMKTTAAK